MQPKSNSRINSNDRFR